MFSALWAIANQQAGAALGLAAPYVYSLPAGAVTDIVPVGSTHNVTASIQEPNGTNKYNANQVMGGASAPQFVSTLWDYPYLQSTEVVISFGQDCTAAAGFGVPTCNQPGTLKTKPGWDNVTGVGVPNAKAFVTAFKPTK